MIKEVKKFLYINSIVLHPLVPTSICHSETLLSLLWCVWLDLNKLGQDWKPRIGRVSSISLGRWSRVAFVTQMRGYVTTQSVIKDERHVCRSRKLSIYHSSPVCKVLRVFKKEHLIKFTILLKFIKRKWTIRKSQIKSWQQIIERSGNIEYSLECYLKSH